MDNRNKRKMLLLHIGTAKTGTTSIQEFLRMNQRMLNEQGWCYPDLYADVNGRHDNINEATDAAMPNGYYLYEVMRRPGLSYRLLEAVVWKDILHKLKTKNVIISCETMFDNLYGISLGKIIDRINRKYENVKVLVYLRRQDYWIESAWNQSVEGNYFHDDIHCFMREYPRANESPDYYAKISEVESVIGKENIIIRVYEKEQLEGERKDSISDFAHVLSKFGCLLDLSKTHIPTRLNPRLTDETLSFALIFGSEFCKYSTENSEEVQELYRLLNDYSLSCGGKSGAYLSSDERKLLLEKYQKGNETIARDYLNRSDGQLFYDTRMEYTQWAKKEYSDIEKKQIMICAAQMGKLFQSNIEKEHKEGISGHMRTVCTLIMACLRTLRRMLVFDE